MSLFNTKHTYSAVWVQKQAPGWFIVKSEIETSLSSNSYVHSV